MTKREKFFWGGVGGTLTLVTAFLHSDMRSVSNVALGELVYYSIRICILFGLGGLYAFLQKTEEIPQLIQLGVIAPLIFSGWIDHNADKTTPPQSLYRNEFISSAMAAEPERDEVKPGEVKRFEDEEPGLAAAANQAITGAKPPTHYLIIGERDNLLSAREFAISVHDALDGKRLLEHSDDRPDLKVNIYLPYKGLKYSVVLAERLSHDEAYKLIKLLLEKDFNGVKMYDLRCQCYPYDDEKKAE